MKKASKQQELDFDRAEMLRDKGIKQAVDHADSTIDNWSERAFNFMRNYLTTTKEFMVEQVREASKGKVPDPPSNRAWGAIVLRARKMGLVRRKGYGRTKNVRAHSTPATIWEVV
ncbi:hypothetical protein [Flagellimonas marina]|uniref:Uncharacterized protein n=1 Tax=Flagellimonas marina TaxID=1775168 RepID=A0ABV8PHN9_9FLAO